MNCPKCDADISDSYQEDDWSCGIVGAYYCEACDIPVDRDDYEPRDDDVPIVTASETRTDQPIGTPIEHVSGRAVPPDHPDYYKFLNFQRVARSWGYD